MSTSEYDLPQLQWEVEDNTGPITGNTTSHTARSRHDDREYEIFEFGNPLDEGRRTITLSMKIDGEEEAWDCHGVDDIASAKAEAEEMDAMTLRDDGYGSWILVGSA